MSISAERFWIRIFDNVAWNTSYRSNLLGACIRDDVS
jgi:hypothetical protein